jgi:phosphohistidine phosphatase
MKLYVMRHAEAEEQAESGGGDEARRLTPRGRMRTRDAADGLHAFDVRFEVILSSPMARAAETADLVSTAYANNPPPQVLPALATGVPPREAVAALAPFVRHDAVMIVGHEPQLSGLLSLLLTGGDGLRTGLKKGACVALKLPKRFELGAAELRWMMTQRQMRKLRK